MWGRDGWQWRLLLVLPGLIGFAVAFLSIRGQRDPGLSKGEVDQLVWGVVALVGSAIGLYLAFRNLRRARIIEDTPTARVRSAPQGYVELNGRAVVMNGAPVIAPLTGSECCWYRYRIQQKRGKDWHTVESGGSNDLFLLRDETGECIIDPEGAEVTPTDQSNWFGSTRYPTDRNPARQRRVEGSWFGRYQFGFTFGIGNHRYQEERIYPGDMVYAIGLFKSLDEVDHQRSRSEMVREILREWKRDHATLLRRFDRDRSGNIDEREWELARRTAYHQAKRQYEQGLEGRVLHTLSRTGSRVRPFLISALPQFDLVRRYRVFAGLGTLLFFVAGGVAVGLLAG